MTAPHARGAYGFALRAERPIGRWLNPAPPGWPALTVTDCADALAVAATAGSDVTWTVDGARVRIDAGGGWRVALDLDAMTATFRGIPIDAPEFVHPGLAAAAAIAARALGRSAFHAGGFVVDSVAWGVIGAREAGKTTLLAALAAAGAPIVADDLLVVEGTRVFAGPRCLDLRGDVPAQLPVTQVRDGQRRRLTLPPAAADYPLAGWLFLDWGAAVGLDRLDMSQRLRALAPARSWAVVGDDAAPLLDAATLPGWRLRRPRRLADLPRVVELLLDPCTLRQVASRPAS
jgi:hypothetical protein